MENIIKSSKKDDLELFYIGEFDENCKNIILSNEIFTNPKKILKALKPPFVFYINDKKNNKFFGARSLFNNKSLFYYTKNFTIFSFKQKELLNSIDLELNLQALSEYLSFMSAKQSFFKYCFELGSGEFVLINKNRAKVEKFDDLKEFYFDEKKQLNKLDFLNLLNEQIAKFSAQNPACLLSGGLDSSLLCALYQKSKNEKIDAFNLAFKDEPHYDESEFAKISANFIACRLNSINITKQDFKDEFYSFYENSCEPLADSAAIALKFLCKQINASGFKSAFSAEGADECFLGYDLYFRVLEFYENEIPPIKYPKISKDSEYLRRKSLNLPIYGGFCEVFTHYQKSLLFANAPKQISINEPILAYNNDFKALAQMRYMDLNIASNGTILKKLNLMSEILSIKTPFLPLWSFALSFNPSPNSIPKEFLKNLAKEEKLLPDEIIFRKKKGLSTPFLEWILKDINVSKEILSINKILGIELFSKIFVSELEKRAKKGRFKQHLWSLLCFSLWLKKYFG